MTTAVDLVLPRDEPLLIADVGSNIGASVAQLVAVRPRAQFVCFEPADRFRAVLIRNLRENGWEQNVRVEGLLLGARAGSKRLFTNTSTASVARRYYGGHHFLGASRRSVVKLDDYFSGATRLDLIKSDTDGFDIDVLLGAEDLLARLAPVLYFEFAPFLTRHVGRTGKQLLEYLAELGYGEFLVFAQAGQVLALTSEPAEILALAETHKYVDLFTAARPTQVSLFPEIVEAIAASTR